MRLLYNLYCLITVYILLAHCAKKVTSANKSIVNTPSYNNAESQADYAYGIYAISGM